MPLGVVSISALSQLMGLGKQTSEEPSKFKETFEEVRAERPRTNDRDRSRLDQRDGSSQKEPQRADTNKKVSTHKSDESKPVSNDRHAELESSVKKTANTDNEAELEEKTTVSSDLETVDTDDALVAIDEPQIAVASLQTLSPEGWVLLPSPKVKAEMLPLNPDLVRPETTIEVDLGFRPLGQQLTANALGTVPPLVANGSTMNFVIEPLSVVSGSAQAGPLAGAVNALALTQTEASLAQKLSLTPVMADELEGTQSEILKVAMDGNSEKAESGKVVFTQPLATGLTKTLSPMMSSAILADAATVDERGGLGAEKPTSETRVQAAANTLGGLLGNAGQLQSKTLAVTVPVNQPNWGQATGERILWAVTQKLQAAELQLDPPELGPLQVKISVHNDQVSLSFVSQHPQVREALDQHALRLREMFEGQGLNLVDVDVSDQSFKQQREQAEQQSANAVEQDDTEIEVTAVSGASVQLVDQFV